MVIKKKLKDLCWFDKKKLINELNKAIDNKNIEKLGECILDFFLLEDEEENEMFMIEDCLAILYNLLNNKNYRHIEKICKILDTEKDSFKLWDYLIKKYKIDIDLAIKEIIEEIINKKYDKKN